MNNTRLHIALIEATPPKRKKTISFKALACCWWLVAGLAFSSVAQKRVEKLAKRSVLRAKVIDADNGSGLPFAAIAVKDHYGVGVNTAMDGKFELNLEAITPQDSLVINYMGYHNRTVSVAQVFDMKGHAIEMTSETKLLGEIVVEAGENPALAFLKKNRKAWRQQVAKDRHHRQSRKATILWETTDKPEHTGWLMADLSKYLTVDKKDGKQHLPVMVAQYDLVRKIRQGRVIETKTIKKEKKGLGFDANGVLGEVMGNAKLMIDNIMNPQVIVMDRTVVSPFNSLGGQIYEYVLADEPVERSGKKFYKLDFEPKKNIETGFIGTLWLCAQDSLLTEVSMKLKNSANQNFLTHFDFDQQWMTGPNGEHYPTVTHYNQEMTGLPVFKHLNAHYTLRDCWLEGKKATSTTAPVSSSNYVAPALAQASDNAMQVMDQLNSTSRIAKFNKWVNVFGSGYYEFKHWDLGHALDFMLYNDIEGARPGAGVMTDELFNKKLFVSAYSGYGVQDQQWKYNLDTRVIFNRQKRLTLGVKVRNELAPLANLSFEQPPLEADFRMAQWGALSKRMPFYQRLAQADFTTRLHPDWLLTTAVRHEELSAPEKNVFRTDMPTPNWIANEGVVELRWSPHDRSLYNKNYRLLRKGGQPYPEFRLGYVPGNVVDGQHHSYTYNKVYFQLRSEFAPVIPSMGETSYFLQAGFIQGKAPFPFLRVSQGIDGPVYAYGSHQIMNSFEFVSDKYVEFEMQHFFEGALFNRVPGLRWLHEKTGMGVVVDFDFAYGGMSKENQQLNAAYFPADGHFQTYQEPYMAVGYGLHNIFKIFFVEYWNRLTYKNQPYSMKNDGWTVGFALRM